MKTLMLQGVVRPDVIYDMSGRVAEHPARGVYVVDGEKVYIKYLI